MADNINFMATGSMQRLNIRYYTDFPTCNYTCEYCIAGHGLTHAKGQSQWDEGRYHTVIDNIAQLPYEINIRLGVGGEFFISKALIKGAENLSHKDNVYSVNLITNLSFSLEQYQKIFSNFDKKKVALVASFHPTQIEDHKQWLDKAVAISQLFDFSVIMVAFPDIMDDIRKHKEYLNSLGVSVFVQAFLGPWKGKQYPQSYTAEQRSFLKQVFYSRHDYEYLVNLKKPGMCNAGFKSIYVSPNGQVYPCGMGAYKKTLGDFSVSPSLALNGSPAQCPFQRCACDTENMNTVNFENNYVFTSRNQHIYKYKFEDMAKTNPAYDEWAIQY